MDHVAGRSVPGVACRQVQHDICGVGGWLQFQSQLLRCDHRIDRLVSRLEIADGIRLPRRGLPAADFGGDRRRVLRPGFAESRSQGIQQSARLLRGANVVRSLGRFCATQGIPQRRQIFWAQLSRRRDRARFFAAVLESSAALRGSRSGTLRAALGHRCRRSDCKSRGFRPADRLASLPAPCSARSGIHPAIARHGPRCPSPRRDTSSIAPATSPAIRPCS